MRKTTLTRSIGVILESDWFWLLCSPLVFHQRSSLALNHPSDPLLHWLNRIIIKRNRNRNRKEKRIISPKLPTGDSTLTRCCSCFAAFDFLLFVNAPFLQPATASEHEAMRSSMHAMFTSNHVMWWYRRRDTTILFYFCQLLSRVAPAAEREREKKANNSTLSFI